MTYDIICQCTLTMQAKLLGNHYNLCMDNFHKVLKELREIKGMTQAQLGKALGYKTHGMIAQWESGKIIPDISNLIVLAKFFDVTIDYLVGLEK